MCTAMKFLLLIATSRIRDVLTSVTGDIVIGSRSFKPVKSLRTNFSNKILGSPSHSCSDTRCIVCRLYHSNVSYQNFDLIYILYVEKIH